VGRKLPRFMADDDGQAILRATTTQRDRLMLLICRYFGLRVSELCHLKVEDLDFKRRILMVREGKGSKDRAIPMPVKMVGPLRGWIGSRREGYVFPSPRGGALTARAVQLLVKRLAKAAGLHQATAARKYSPHKFRHLYCTHLLHSGADIIEVRDLAGHSSVATTQIYTHSDPKRLQAAVDRLFGD